jgi:uncharacterized membrane protein (DUF4010 family)
MMELADFQNLAVAAATGFLIGFEREWRDTAVERERFAGARTFAIVGFAGGAAMLLDGGGALAAAGLLAVAALAVTSFLARTRVEADAGATTEVALIAAYLIGALAGFGAPALAGAAGVAVAILLALKPRVEAMARAIDAKEISAALRFLALAVIVLPLAPSVELGPGGAFNPQVMWRFVVLISGLSFAGYWLVKYFGARGVLLTGLVGGLASSTATTLSIARLARDGAASARVAAAGAVAANTVMFARIAVLLFVASRPMFNAFWPTLAAAGAVGVAAAYALAREKAQTVAKIELSNPLELRTALLFALFLSIVIVAADVLVDRFGAGGLIALAAVAGLADLDALTLSAASQVEVRSLAPAAAIEAVSTAIAVNMALKGGFLAAIAGRRAGATTLAVFLAMAAAGAAAHFLTR